MTTELAAAILARRKLRLDSIWSNSEPNARYRAIFVWSDRDEYELQPPVTWAFTSARKAAAGSQALDPNDIDRYVFLTVDAECLQGDGAPQLRVREWLLGMCFFDGNPRTEVVFPWPRVLWELRP
ncbi:hypothetical protein CGRA01v4_12838 [Colletotrichum graminicola]|uniref:Heterokaryon incompatibility protein n=1 Tax=Colletotrichum graminicola (strain M1.001 / M2 / FGSC 10212) TaxID=645133 RepID=E3QIV1_COLGM|nr:uncharacterized protein GLRG_05933 [Colletotrichum graminicola M1.001]EFQ30789.1 hypothetical protein GLRG_05933 [Colletotrichum graminicola M1.001]WDK21548.1 hypothetical protein CGRA01v4_12838 [Colletotrichum graminicola]